jgi:hypothetical protein
MISTQAIDGFLQAAADGWHFGEFCRWQVVEVLVHGGAGVDFVGDTIQARHDDGREAQIGVGRWVGEAHFYALGLGVRREGNAAGGRAVAGRIGQQHGCFIAGNQTLVGVRRWVGESVQGLGMLDDAADEVEAGLRKIRILIT